MIILLLGVVVLAGGSAALLVVRVTSPRLRGTGWLSSAFAAGSLGAGLLLVRGIPALNLFAADLALLLSFVLLHVAVLTLIENPSIQFWHGGVLIAAQLVVDALEFGHMVPGRIRIVSIGVLIAVQCTSTAAILWREARPRIHTPAAFSAVLLIFFAALNLFRSVLEAFFYAHRTLNDQLSLITFSLYIGVALGLAFGFFWMTTSTLTAELEHMASTDPLTRLYNRRVFLKWCEKELLRSQRSAAPFSVLMIDLDHFKSVNDSFGHQTGDEVLCSAVEQMQDSVRGIDVLCRWGGEEFAVLLPNASLDATRIVAERIRLNIQKVTLSAARNPDQRTGAFQLTVSIGAATYRDLGDGIASMLARADKALYEAKGTGRNRVLVAV